MKCRLLNVLTALSLLLFVALIGLTMFFDWRRQSGPHQLSDAGPRLEVNNEYLLVFNRGFPFINGIMGTVPRDVRFDFAGIHFRYFRLPDATTWWTLAVPLAYLFV